MSLISDYKTNNLLPEEIKKKVIEEAKEKRQKVLEIIGKISKDLDLSLLSEALSTIRKCQALEYEFDREFCENVTPILYSYLFHSKVDNNLKNKIARELKLLFKDFNENLVDLIKKIRRYFKPEATEEILETILPRFCPHDSSIYSAQAFLCLFLPSNTKNTSWIEKVFNLWDWTENSFAWDFHFFELLSRFAKDHPGFDWSKYEKTIFTKILFSMELPIGKETPKYYQRASQDSLSIFAKQYERNYKLPYFTSKLIIYMLEKNNNTLTLLKKLISSVEFYFHPSNIGNYSSALAVWLGGLCKQFTLRFKKEKKSFISTISKEFTELTLPIADLSLFSKSVPLGFQATQSFKHLSYLHPEIVFPKVYERMMYAFQTLTETHQSYVVYELFVVTHFSILQNVQDKNFLGDVFSAALPGIDSNDKLKTNLALDFYFQLLCTIPIIVSGKRNSEFSMEESDDVSVTFLHEWSLELLKKLFGLIEHQNPKEKSDKKNILNSPPRLENISLVLFSQMSKEIYEEASQLLIKFVLSNYHPNGKELLGYLCHGASCASSEFSSKLFKAIYQKLIEKEKLDHLNEDEISYYLYLLGKTFSGIQSSESILKLKKEIFQLITLTMERKEKSILKATKKLLKGIVVSLSQIYPTDLRSVPSETWKSKEFQETHYKEWGKSIPFEKSNLTWHFPSKEELSFLTELYNQLGDSYGSKLTSDYDSLVRIYVIVKAFKKVLLEINQDVDDSFTRSQTFYDPFSYITETKYTKYFWAQALDKHFENVVSKIEPKYSLLYIKTIETLLLKRVKNSKESEKKEMIKQMDYRLFESNCEKRVYPRMKYVVLAKSHLNSRRYDLRVPFSKIHMEILLKLKKLSLGEYSTIRTRAQSAFKTISSQFKNSLTKKFVPELLDILKKKDVQKDELNGAIYLIMSLEKSIKFNSDLFHQLIISICQCNDLELPSIQQRINLLFQQYVLSYEELKPNPSKYSSLIKDLITLDSEKIHWKNRLMIHTILNLFVRSDLTPMYPIEASKVILRALNSDIAPLREAAAKNLNLIFTQYKPMIPKKIIKLDPSGITFEESKNVPQPKNQKEWEEAHFFEKNFFGFLQKPKETKVYDYQAEIPNNKEREEFVKEMSSILSQDFISNMLSLMTLTPQKFESSGSGYQFGYAQMFKGMFQLFKFDFFEKIQAPLEKLLSHSGSGKPEEEQNIEVAVQAIAGLIRGMKHWKFDEREKVIVYIKPIFKKLFETCSLSCNSHVELCLRFCVYDSDVRRCRWLIHFLIDLVDLENGTSTDQSKQLSFLYNALSEVTWRDENLFERVNKILTLHLNHPYQQVRDMISKLSSLYFRFYFKPTYTIEKAPEKEDKKLEIINQMKKVYQESKEKGPIMKFILGWYDNTLKTSFLSASVYLEELLPIVLDIYDKTSSDNDLQMASKICLIQTSSSYFHFEIAKKVVKVLSSLNQFDSWRVRFAIISFFQLFAFRHQFYDISVIDSLISSLSDKSVEVRTLASSTLAGFIKISSSETINQFITKFMKKIKKPTNDQEVLECHSIILGLSSIIQAFPYDVPEFLPKVLVHLSKYSDYKSPIGPSVKKTFSDFWKSHQDTWNLHKDKFTEDELFIISQLKSSSQYFV